MNTILKQLTEIEAELKKPFPTRDINKIYEVFKPEFLNFPVTGAFLMKISLLLVNIAGKLKYVFRKINKSISTRTN